MCGDTDNSSESSGGRGRGGYGAGNRSRSDAAELAESQRSDEGMGGRSERSVDVEDRSTQYSGRNAGNNYSSQDLANSRRDLADAGLSRSNYADTGIGSLADARDELANNKAAYSNVVADEYVKKGINGLPDQVRETMVGDYGIASDLKNNISSDDRRKLSRDIAGRRSNGVVGSLASLAGPAGALVNGALDAKQAYDFSKEALGVAPSLGETLGTGMLSTGKRAITSVVAGKVGEVAGGVIGKVVDPYAGAVSGLLASKLTSDFINNPSSNNSESSGIFNEAGGGKDKNITSVEPVSAAQPTQVEVANAGYNSKFGDYDSHINNFKYNPNTALDAWKI